MTELGLRSLARNATGIFARQLLTGLMQLAIVVIIARVYGPEGNGRYVTALLLPNLLATFLNLGVSPANVYFIASDKVSVGTAWRSSLKLCLIMSLVGLGVGAIVIHWFGEQWFPGVTQSLLWFSLIIFPISLLLGFMSSLYQGMQQFMWFNLILLMQPAINLTLIILLIISGNRGIELLFITYLSGSIITLLIGLYFLRPFLLKDITSNLNESYSIAALNYGYKAHLSNIFAFIIFKADIFLVNFFLGPSGAGIYIIAVQLVERLWMVSQAVSIVLLPRLSALSSHEDRQNMITPLISRSVIFVTLLGAFVLAALAHPVIMILFGADFVASFKPLLILLPGIVASAGARVLANDLAARGRPELNMYTSWIALVVNLLGNILLIPDYGLSGAAVATTLCYSTILILRVVMYSHFTGVAWQRTVFIRMSDFRGLKLMIFNRVQEK